MNSLKHWSRSQSRSEILETPEPEPEPERNFKNSGAGARAGAKNYKIPTTALNHGFPLISKSDYETLVEILELLTPVAKFTERLQKEDIPTISLLLPGLLSLFERLKTSVNQQRLSNILIDYLEARFSHVLQSGKYGMDPVYLNAAILDTSVVDTLVRKRQFAIDDARISLRD